MSTVHDGALSHAKAMKIVAMPHGAGSGEVEVTSGADPEPTVRHRQPDAPRPCALQPEDPHSLFKTAQAGASSARRMEVW
jgi:hypothetical protein